MIRNQKGFTLIEIIAVLVILGILAAVAIPRFMDLQADARTAALKGAVAAGKANLSNAYAKALVLGGSGNGTVGTTGLTMTGLTGTIVIPTDLGDFTAAYAGTSNGQDCTVTISGDATRGTAWVNALNTTAGSGTVYKCPWYNL